MSASIYWRPVATGKRLDFGMAPSSVIEIIGPLPRSFTAGDLSWLGGVKAAIHQQAKDGVQELIEAIERHGEIEVFAFY